MVEEIEIRLTEDELCEVVRHYFGGKNKLPRLEVSMDQPESYVFKKFELSNTAWDERPKVAADKAPWA